MDQQGHESSEKSWGGRQVEHADKKKSNSATDASGKSCGASRAKGGSGLAAALMGPGPPCGACKFLRRKCIFSPYFGSDQGAARFAAVHKVFGASNVSKLLLHIAANRRHDAMVTISYEAQARLSDPVYGCLSTILALRHQVAALQSELAMVQTQLMNSRLAVANALRNAAQQEQQLTMLHAARPGYSNTSSASNNLISLGNDNYPSSFDLADAAHAPAPARSFDLLQPSASSALARRRRGGKLPGFHSFRHPHPRPRVKQTYQLSYPL